METLDQLVRRGVLMPETAGIEIGPEVDVGRIAGEGTVVHSGCRIFGERTLILPGARIGAEAPATIENCFVGPGVELKGGFFKDAVFLSGASCGSGSHVREGTILEEQASIAHAVGLKQTILFPFVTLGSLINFCDCLMAGGTGRRRHSEVGSSYIHFNFTPNQDKATASLIGDVPRGVMLNQPPIFLGGQGGMVGPIRLDYGTTVAAGTILRKDELRPNRLIFGEAGKAGNVANRAGRYSDVSRIARNNLYYIANLLALRHWYRDVRALFIGDRFPDAFIEGLLQTLDSGIAERMRRLNEFFEKAKAGGDSAPAGAWPSIEEEILRRKEDGGDSRLRDSFKEKVLSAIARTGKNYIDAIQGLGADESGLGSAWLQGIVDATAEAALQKLKA
jgi:UDP-N-acetylglucosamine/UDP-N-acetylgalactosamine diphosphorylase